MFTLHFALFGLFCHQDKISDKITSSPQGFTSKINEDAGRSGVTVSPQGSTSVTYEDVGFPPWAKRWEILWTNVRIDDQILGKGNFGEVRSGSVKIGDKVTKSAIKVLKGEHSSAGWSSS